MGVTALNVKFIFFETTGDFLIWLKLRKIRTSHYVLYNFFLECLIHNEGKITSYIIFSR